MSNFDVKEFLSVFEGYVFESPKEVLTVFGRRINEDISIVPPEFRDSEGLADFAIKKQWIKSIPLKRIGDTRKLKFSQEG